TGQACRTPKNRRGRAQQLERAAGKRPGAAPRRSDGKRFVDAYTAQPCHDCRDVDTHLARAAKLSQSEEEPAQLTQPVRRRQRTETLARAARRIENRYRSLHETEAQHDVELLKEPDAGFMARIYEWASGRSLEDVLSERETSAGDFVRSTKQVVDLLQQLKVI